MVKTAIAIYVAIGLPWMCLCACPQQAAAQTEPSPTPELVLRSENEAFSGYAMSPDGRWYAAYGDRQLRIYSMADGLLYRTIPIAEKDAILSTSVAVLANGQEILVPGSPPADGRGRVLRFRVEDGVRLPDLVLAEKGLVTEVACDRSDDKVAVYLAVDEAEGAGGGGKSGPRVVRMATGHEVFRHMEVTHLPVALALSADGSLMAMSNAGEFKVFGLRAGAAKDGLTLAKNLRPDAERALMLSPSGALAAVQQNSNPYGEDVSATLQVFRTSDGAALPAVTTVVEGADFVTEEEMLEAGPYEIRLLNLKTGVSRHLWDWRGQKYYVSRPVLTPDRKRALLGLQFGSVVAEYPSGTLIGNEPIPVQRSFEYEFRKDGSSARASGLVTNGEWDLDTGEYRANGDELSTTAVVSPDGRTVARTTVYGLEVSTRGGITRKLLTSDLGQWYLAAFTADSRMLAAAWSPATQPRVDEIRLLTLPDLNQVAVLKVPEGGLDFVTHITFSKDGLLAVSSQDTVAVYRLADEATLTEVKRFGLPQELHVSPLPDRTRPERESNSPFGRAVLGLTFSPDGTRLAVAGNFLHLYLTSTWAEEGVAAKRSVGCVEWMPDGSGLLAMLGPDERTVTLEDLDQPAEMSVVDAATGRLVAADATARIQCPAAVDSEGRVIVSRTLDGVALYSSKDFGLLGTMYEFKGGEWMFATPEGLFDGTPGAWRYLGWRLGGKTFDLTPVEVFFRQFYRPGLLADVFAGREVKGPPVALASVDRRQPVVRVAVGRVGSTGSGAATAKVRVEAVEVSGGARSKGSGVRDLRLFRNGVLVKAWRGEMRLDAAGRAGVETTVPIVAGENRFTAYGFNDADVKSLDAEAVVEGAAALARKGVAYVVTIGIDRYAASTVTHKLNLTYAEADAKDFGEAFRAAQEKTGGFSEVKVIPLMSEQATRENIEAALGALAGRPKEGMTTEQTALLKGVEQVRPEDGVFVFYAGHGIASDTHFYLLPSDIRLDRNRLDPESHTLSDEDLSSMLEGIGAGRGFVVIDACHSGRALEGEDAGGGPTNARGLAQLAYEKGMDILTASQAEELAGEDQKLAGGHGYLTYALVEEGLKRGEAASEGRVELREWFRFASRRVPELQTDAATGTEAGQHPRAFYRRDVEKKPFIVADQ